VKELLDYGRVVYLRKFGVHSELVHFVDTEATYENVAIVSTMSPIVPS